MDSPAKSLRTDSTVFRKLNCLSDRYGELSMKSNGKAKSRRPIEREYLAALNAAGIKLPQRNTGETSFSHQGGAESGAHSAPIGADLQAIIQRWPELPNAVKAGIVAMVKAADGGRIAWPVLPPARA
jgi:hypothetical protein